MARMACTNAMLRAGRHHDAQPVASDRSPLSAAASRIDRGDELRDSGAVLVAVGLRLRQRRSRRVQRCLRRAVVHDALPEEIVPGSCRMKSPITAMIGAWIGDPSASGYSDIGGHGNNMSAPWRLR